MIQRLTSSIYAGQMLPMAAMVLLIAILTLNRLGASDVCGGSEAIMGVFVQQMVEQDQLLFPLDNCQVPMYKPPLFHWSSTALDYLRGEHTVTAFNLRLPSALYATAGAVVTMLFAFKLLGLRGGLLSGAILAGSYQYISQGRIGLVDMTLTFFQSLSLYAFLWWFLTDTEAPAALPRKHALHYLFAISMGLGVLAKGPVGAILPATTFIIFLALRKSWQTLLDLFKTGPFVLGAAIASSWYFACLIGKRFSFLSLQLGSENFGRFFGSLGAMSSWYYLKPLLLNSIPLSLLVPVAVVTALVTRAADPHVTHHSNKYRSALCARFLATFWVVTVVFFELSAFKRRAYLLPLWPASAVLLSWWVLNYIVPRVGIAAYQGLMALCLLLAIGNLFFLPAYEMHGCGKYLSVVEILKWPFESLAGRPYAEGFQRESFREAAAQIDKAVGRNEPLYVFKVEDAIEPLVFYLDRCVRQSPGSLNDVPAGYILTTTTIWNGQEERASHLNAVLIAPYRDNGLVLLH